MKYIEKRYEGAIRLCLHFQAVFHCQILSQGLGSFLKLDGKYACCLQ